MKKQTGFGYRGWFSAIGNRLSMVAGVALAAGMMAGTAWAGDIYVSTNGLQQNTYANWADAFTNLQAALDYVVTKTNATIYLAGDQTFSTPTNGADATSLYVWQNATNVTLSGGWQTDAVPPVTRIGGTVLRRLAASGNRRVLRMAGVSNAVIEQVTIREGRQGTQNAHGSGLFVTNCQAVTISGCSILFNTNAAANSYGAGVGVQRSDVVLTNCTVANNYNDMQYSGAAGLYVDPASRVTMVRSFLLGNRQGGQGGNISYGPGFYNQGNLRMLETVVATNASYANNAWGGGGYNTGFLLMQNCLVVSNKYNSTGYADGIHLASGTGVFVNCTFANNAAVGIQYGGGTVAMTNCIAWGHSSADLLSLPKDANGVMTDVWYSDIGDGGNNGYQGCLKTDPLFVDTTYYHLKSTEGNYTGGYFTGGSWTTAEATSPLIDRGPPAPYDYSREPAPNGSWVNMGYDGNTEVASKSPAVSVVAPSVTNYDAAAVGHRTAMLRGEVPATGGELPQGFFRYWVSGSGTTNEIAAGYTSGYFERYATGLTPGTLYEYLVAASNSAGETVSTVSSFATHGASSSLYVATNGNNTAGTNWVTAYTAVQPALNLAEPGDTLYLAGHTFVGGISGTIPAHPNNAFLIWRNATNITLKGGYDAVAGGGSNPGNRNSVTELKRTVGSGVRVLSMIGLTNCTLDQVTIRDGTPGTMRGVGAYLTNCWAVTFAACTITNNGGNGNIAGAGLYAHYGSVLLTNCLVVDNRQASNVDHGGLGGDIGGGICAARGSFVTVVRSTIRGNQGDSTSWNNSGGGFVVMADGRLELYESILQTNKSTLANSISGGAGANYGGILRMQNCLVANNIAANSAANRAEGINLQSGTSTVINCTIVNTNAVTGIRYGGGVVGVTNCIVVGHTNDFYNFGKNGLNQMTNVWHTLSADPNQGGFQGCISNNNPAFIDTVYYHEQSTTNCYTGGYFSGGYWTNSPSFVKSPAIDKGDATPPTREPDPNGGIINMGAYGNTEVAAGTPFEPKYLAGVTNTGALYWGHRSAQLNGLVITNGNEDPVCTFLYWDTGSGPTSAIPVGVKPVGSFIYPLTGLTPGASYAYYITASNTAGVATSTVANFSMHPSPSFLYVATNGNDTAGTNWVTAYSTVQKALDLAEANDTIYLAGHTFAGGKPVTPAHPANAFVIWQNATNVAVKGGYDAQAGTGGSDPGTRSAMTTLRVNAGANRVLTMSGVTNCTVEQVTIRDGLATEVGGGGVYLTNCWDVTFASCVVSNNGGGGRYGQGMYLNQSSVVLTNTTIANNIVLGMAWYLCGGGIYIDSLSRMTAIRSSVVRNGFPESIGNFGNGAGIAVGGVLNLYESVVSGNMAGTATYGGGIYNSGTLTMRNCLVYSNTCLAAGYADGLHLAAGMATVANCTFAYNRTSGISGIGIQYVGGTVAITNSIMPHLCYHGRSKS